MPTVWVRPFARPTAPALGVYPVAAITSRTRMAVDASTSPLLFSTRDTVVLLTRARRAPSAIVTRIAPRLRPRTLSRSAYGPQPSDHGHVTVFDLHRRAGLGP